MREGGVHLLETLIFAHYISLIFDPFVIAPRNLTPTSLFWFMFKATRGQALKIESPLESGI